MIFLLSCVLLLVSIKTKVSILQPHLKHVLPLLFGRFPLSKPQLASKWVQSLGMKNFIPTANTCLCSEHFRTDCFRDYNGKQFLREDAVPTIFNQGQDTSKVWAQNTLVLLFTCVFYSLIKRSRFNPTD